MRKATIVKDMRNVFSRSKLLVHTFPSDYLVLTHKNSAKITYVPKILGCFTAQYLFFPGWMLCPCHHPSTDGMNAGQN